MKNDKKEVVREIMMGSPVTLKPEDTLDLANDVISLGRIRHIPVVEDGRLIGLLSERDLMGAATTTIFGLKQKSKSALLKTFLIKDVMKKKVFTVKPDTPIKDAAHLMNEIVEIEGLELDDLFAAESEELAREFGSALHGAGDFLEGRGDFGIESAIEQAKV